MAQELFAQLSPHDFIAVALQPHEATGVKGLDAVGHAVLVQLFYRCGGEGIVVSPLGLQLHNDGRATLKEGKHLPQQGNPLLRALKAILLQIRHRQVINHHIHPRRAKEGGIVNDRQVAIRHQVDIQLHGVEVIQCAAKSRHGVLGDGGLIV